MNMYFAKYMVMNIFRASIHDENWMPLNIECKPKALKLLFCPQLYV